MRCDRLFPSHRELGRSLEIFACLELGHLLASALMSNTMSDYLKTVEAMVCATKAREAALPLPMKLAVLGFLPSLGRGVPDLEPKLVYWLIDKLLYIQPTSCNHGDMGQGLNAWLDTHTYSLDHILRSR